MSLLPRKLSSGFRLAFGGLTTPGVENLLPSSITSQNADRSPAFLPKYARNLLDGLEIVGNSESWITDFADPPQFVDRGVYTPPRKNSRAGSLFTCNGSTVLVDVQKLRFAITRVAFTLSRRQKLEDIEAAEVRPQGLADSYDDGPLRGLSLTLLNPGIVAQVQVATLGNLAQWNFPPLSMLTQ
jgi:hypothetical protein